MDYFDLLTQQRIDSETADAVDELLSRALPSLVPCAVPLKDVLEQLPYPVCALPPDSNHYAQTALAVIEAFYPEECDYLPDELEARKQTAWGLVKTLRLDVRCMEIPYEKATQALYDAQRAQFEVRGTAFGLVWTPKPICICAELTSGYCLVTGSELLRMQIIVARGVTERDIAERSAELIAYLRAKQTLQP